MNHQKSAANNLKPMLAKSKTSKEILKEIVRLTNNTHSKTSGLESRQQRSKNNTLNREK